MSDTILPRKHIPALLLGYGTMAAAALVLAAFVYKAITQGYGGSPVPSAHIPFSESNSVTGSTVLAYVDGPHNFQDDGSTCYVWRLAGDIKQLRDEVNNKISARLVWHAPLNTRDRQLVDYVRDYNKEAKLAPWIQEVLAADDCHIAYVELDQDVEQMRGASLYLLSPRKMLLVYLNANVPPTF